MRIVKIQEAGKKEYHIGIEYTKPFIGGNYSIYPSGDLATRQDNEKGFQTSQVIEIIDEHTFVTKLFKEPPITYKIKEHNVEI